MSVDSKFFPKNWINHWLKSMWWWSVRLWGLRFVTWVALQARAGWGGNLTTSFARVLGVSELLHIRLVISKFIEKNWAIKGLNVLFNVLPKSPISKKHLNAWMGKGKGPFTGVWELHCRQFTTLCTVQGLSTLSLKKLKFILESKLSYLGLRFYIWWSVGC